MKTRALLAVLGVAGASLLAIADTAEKPGIGWEKDLAAATKRAASSERPLMVDVGAVWCAPCKQMERTTCRDERVVEASGAVVPVHVDADAQPTFTERYAVEAFPTILFLDADGQEITRRTGYQSAEDLLRTLRQVTAGYAGYKRALGQKDDPKALEDAAVYLLQAGNPSGAASLLKKAMKIIGGRQAPNRESVELRLAEAQLAQGDSKPAAQVFERLYNGSSDPSVRGRALMGLVLALRKRGSPEAADRALALLKEQYPVLASELAGSPSGS